MLLTLGYGMVITVMVLVMTKRMVASTDLSAALLDIHDGDNQKSSWRWVFGLVLAMIGGALLFGVIPFVATV